MLAYLDYFLPMKPYVSYSTDKPWINKRFKELIRKRQMAQAYLAGDKTAYRNYRNQVSRISRKLRFRYYEKKVQQLHETDQHSWWKQVQKFLDIKPKPAYSGLDIPANKSAPNTINEFFVSVADDLEHYDQNFWICQLMIIPVNLSLKFLKLRGDSQTSIFIRLLARINFLVGY